MTDPCPECGRRSGHKLDCTQGRTVPEPQPDERLILKDPWWLPWVTIGTATAAVVVLIALLVSGVI